MAQFLVKDAFRDFLFGTFSELENFDIFFRKSSNYLKIGKKNSSPSG
jgi:hypothetical protein